MLSRNAPRSSLNTMRIQCSDVMSSLSESWHFPAHWSKESHKCLAAVTLPSMWVSSIDVSLQLKIIHIYSIQVSITASQYSVRVVVQYSPFSCCARKLGNCLCNVVQMKCVEAVCIWAYEISKDLNGADENWHLGFLFCFFCFNVIQEVACAFQSCFCSVVVCWLWIKNSSKWRRLRLALSDN